MPQRLTGFLVVLVLVLFQNKTAGQELPFLREKVMRYSVFIQPDFGFRLPEKRPETAAAASNMFVIKSATSFFSLRQVISASGYTDRLGFFCRQEFAVQKLTNLPVFFRLGSLEYVNWMEQKPNAIKPR